jgi:hypothetical protein
MRGLSYIMALMIIFGVFSCGKSEKDAEVTDSLPLLITKIRSTSRLYTTEYKVHKIVTHNDELKFEGSLFGHEFSIPIPAGERKIAIPMDVTLKGYIDFEGFSQDNVRCDSNHIELILPDPEVALTSSRIDHDRVKDHVALFRSRFSDEELSSYERQGRASVIRTIPKMGIEAKARENAVRVLVPLLQQFGYAEQDITISFRQDFTPDSITVKDLTNHAGR